MRLKCIRLAGFKSFVDPTTVSFPGSMSAVVGPNGCGKSNIIDAVRWVLGESSAKNLRGEAMTDVIFNGSNTRKPVSLASIELVFDNSGGGLGGEYASYAEISIRRSVTREAKSTYYLNGSKCRRRDITDIFLGTGLGPRSYAIIEQGMISKLIEARPDELRIFIEEAAGISKYKERRRETENRIRRTQDNLARLSDLRDELGRQLERLARQAQTAERYQQLQQQLTVYRDQLTAMRWQVLQQQRGQLEQLLQEQQTRLQQQMSLHYQADARMEQLRDQQHELGEGFSVVQGRFYALGADVARTEQAIQHAQQRLRQLQDDLRDAQRQRQEVQEHLQQDHSALEQLEAEHILLEENLAEAVQQDELAHAVLLETEQSLEKWQEQWQHFNAANAEPKQQVKLETLRIEQLTHSGQQLQQRILRLKQEQRHLGVQQDADGLAHLLEQLEELAQQLEEVEQQQQATRLRQEQESDKVKELQQTQHQLRTTLQRCQGQISALQVLQQDSQQAGAELQDWLQQQGLEHAPRLLDELRVEPGWEHAVEMVLGDYIQSICVELWPGALEQLKNSRLCLMQTSAVRQPVEPRSLLAKVQRCSVELAPWLGRFYCADDLTHAHQLLAELPQEASVVTADGFCLGAGFVRVQTGQEQSGALQRSQQLQLLQQQYDELQQQLAQNEQSLQEAEQRMKAQKAQVALWRQQEQQCQRTISEHKSRLAAEQVRQEQVSEREQQVAEQLLDLHEQQAIECEQQEQARLLLEEAQQQVAMIEQQAQQLQTRQVETRSAFEQARSRAQTAREQLQQIKLQLGTVLTQKQSTQQALERLRAQISRTEQRQQQLSLDLQEGESPIDELRAKLEEQLQQRLFVDEELRAARLAVEETENQMRAQEQQRQQALLQAEQMRDEAEQLRLQQRELEVQQQALNEQLEQNGQQVHEVLLGLPMDAEAGTWQQQVLQLEGQIQRLGAINLSAIEEYRQQSERKLYLDTQDEDLQDALATLENVIRKIDRETRQRFRETFERINAGVQTLFPKVFGGGTASLELTGEDLLDTGVAIMARPPGKKNSTIHLLSGGEKALTALALVFAIFQLNPAPFCMLDEVDAPLDDANVERYARLVKEMSDKVQFIYITHNKIAMEMADHLLGVTMQEPGCSRMVTVDLAQAAEMAQM